MQSLIYQSMQEGPWSATYTIDKDLGEAAGHKLSWEDHRLLSFRILDLTAKELTSNHSFVQRQLSVERAQ